MWGETYLLNEVMTAMSRRSTPACSAMRDLCAILAMQYITARCGLTVAKYFRHLLRSK